jgi:hypothetical protein
MISLQNDFKSNAESNKTTSQLFEVNLPDFAKKMNEFVEVIVGERKTSQDKSSQKKKVARRKKY